jgi:hypothetical protein
MATLPTWSNWRQNATKLRKVKDACKLASKRINKNANKTRLYDSKKEKEKKQGDEAKAKKMQEYIC